MRQIILILICFCIAFAPAAKGAAVAGGPAEEIEKNLDDAARETVDELDLSGFEELMRLLREYNDITFTKTIRQMLTDVLNGNNEFDFRYFIGFFGKLLLGSTVNILPQLAVILVIALLYGVLHNLISGFGKTGTQKIVYLACYGVILTVVASMIAGSVTRAIRAFELAGKFNDLCFPVLLTLVTALGGAASASVYSPFVLLFGAVIMKIINFVVMPLFYITFVFGIVGNLSDELKLKSFSATAKSIAEWIMGITFGLFITILTAQGITGAGFDSLASRGVKYVLSSYVPIVGEYLKDGLDIVVAGCIVVKNALGLCSVTIMIFAVLIPVVRILIIMFGLKLTAAVLEPVTESKFSDALSVVADSMKLLIIGILCVFLSIIIMLMLIIFTCNPGAPL